MFEIATSATFEPIAPRRGCGIDEPKSGNPHETLQFALSTEQATPPKRALLETSLRHLKTNTRMILGLLALETDRGIGPEGRREAGELAARGLAILHERVDREGAVTVDLPACLRELGALLARFHASLGIDLALTVEGEPVVVGAEEAVSLGLIVNELVADVAELTVPGTRCQITLELRPTAAAGVRLSVELGEGCQAGHRHGELDLGYVEALAARLGAEVAIASSPARGTRIMIVLPRSEG